jgi:hypothetical protein
VVFVENFLGGSNGQNVFTGGSYSNVRYNLLISMGFSGRDEVFPETPVKK